ncbi:uncharacterized protein LOC122818630 [Drosophila biarmipes]|uniref:uncharacterized protein LOC122818630 n=1 Tax=Drosophila biarmipes TaxID=125945 RepID=UPI0021CC9CC3|nr:uncharacterized protein LOC122818630 [Drosophila biarmipes]
MSVISQSDNMCKADCGGARINQIEPPGEWQTGSVLGSRMPAAVPRVAAPPPLPLPPKRHLAKRAQVKAEPTCPPAALYAALRFSTSHTGGKYHPNQPAIGICWQHGIHSLSVKNS